MYNECTATESPKLYRKLALKKGSEFDEYCSSLPGGKNQSINEFEIRSFVNEVFFFFFLTFCVRLFDFSYFDFDGIYADPKRDFFSSAAHVQRTHTPREQIHTITNLYKF